MKNLPSAGERQRRLLKL